MAAKPTDKNTKAEILTAYNQLAEEKKSLEAQVKNAQKQTAAPIPISTPAVVNSEPKATISTTLINKDKVNYTIASLDGLQLGFGSAVSELSEKLTIEAAKLADIRSAVATEVTNLQTLHHLEVSEDTFESLIDSYETSSKAFSEELAVRQEAY
jgi:capsid portal protein